MTPSTFVTELRAAFAARARPAKAEQMRAYMKSALPYFGVALPEARRITRALAKNLVFDDLPALERLVRHLYGKAKHREERYAALTLLDLKQTRGLLTLEARPLVEWLITEGAWWDLVDEVATHRLLPWFDQSPTQTATIIGAWSRSSDLWLRRAAIISQVLRGPAVDLELLFAAIEPAIGEPEFFLRKAIGWALRAAAKTNGPAVRAYVEEHRSRLSGLSIREAEKGLR